MFNNYNIRISYSCIVSLEKIIKAHNQKVLIQQKPNKSQCKCAGSCKYPLKGGNFRSMNIVYKAIVNSEHKTKFYIGLCSIQFRNAYHKESFKYGINVNDPKL